MKKGKTLTIPGVKGVEIDVAKLRLHVMRPQHLEGCQSDLGAQSIGAPPLPKPLKSKTQHGKSKHSQLSGRHSKRFE
jgi:hypothetical protein